MNSSYYKYCLVPQCKNTSIKTPNKLFIYIPNNQQIRQKWLRLSRRDDAHCLSTNTRSYFCEDHFDLPNDMLNYTEYRVMGTVSQVRMKPGCTPSKFGCQEDRRKRPSSSTELSSCSKSKKIIIEDKLTHSNSELNMDKETYDTRNRYSNQVINEIDPSTDKNAEQDVIKVEYEEPMSDAADVPEANAESNMWMSKPNVCRCCVSACGTWDLTTMYTSADGERQDYLNMLEECYGIILSNITEWGPSRQVCDNCAISLRLAHNFKQQVMRSEAAFVTYLKSIKEGNKLDLMEVKIKNDSEQQTSVDYGEEQEQSRDIIYSTEIKIENDYNIDIEEHIMNPEESTVEVTTPKPNESETIKEKQTINKKPVAKRPKKGTNKKTTGAKKAIKRRFPSRKQMKEPELSDKESDVDIAVSDFPPSSDKKKASKITGVKKKKEIKRKMSRKQMREPRSSDTESELEFSSVPAYKEPKYSQEIINEVSARMRVSVTCETVLRYTNAFPFRHSDKEMCKYKCFYCCNIFNEFKLIKAHTKTHTPDDLGRIKHRINALIIDITDLKCNICDAELEDVDIMTKHMLDTHEKIVYKEWVTAYKFVDYIVTNVGSNEDSNYKIAVKKSVGEKKKSDLVNEVSTANVSDNTDSIVEPKTANVSARKRIRVTCDTVLKHTTACPFRYHKSWFQCFFCRKNFMELDMLKQHMIENCSNEDINIDGYPRTLQIEITDLQCKICQTDLADVTSMVQHFSDVHNKVIYKEFVAGYKVNKSPYTCHICNKQFHVFRTLTVHLSEHYANFMCNVCGKSFLNWIRLAKHKRLHDKGPFPCDECGDVISP